MTSPKQPPVPETVGEDAVADTAQATTPASAIPAFSFPFKPAEFAEAKKAGQPSWYQKNAQGQHHKTPGAAPSGTRRSMGKR